MDFPRVFFVGCVEWRCPAQQAMAATGRCVRKGVKGVSSRSTTVGLPREATVLMAVGPMQVSGLMVVAAPPVGLATGHHLVTDGWSEAVTGASHVVPGVWVRV